MEEKLKKQGKLLRTTAGLEPYSGEWSIKQAVHLLRRTNFGPRWSELQLAVQNGLPWTVDTLLDDTLPVPDPPGEWANQPTFDRPITVEQRDSYRQWLRDTKSWWLRLMVDQGISIREKMVLFWHDHFAVRSADVKIPHYMYYYIRLLRQHSLGNFKDMLNAMTVDPAMLYFLDGRLNTRDKPNENWAREVLELFTLGEGNYTEDDIKEASKAYTGWVVRDDQPLFLIGRHSGGLKTIMGKRGFWRYDDANDIILAHPDPEDPSISLCSRLICRKLYKFFVYEEPDEDIVRELAATFYANNYDIIPVMRQLLMSAHFFDDSTVGALVKDPIDLIVGSIRHMGISDSDDWRAIQVGDELGQELLDPPDVSGWAGYHNWISTSTLPRRHNFTNNLIDGEIDPSTSRRSFHTFDVVNDVALQVADSINAEELIDNLALMLLAFPLNESLRNVLLETMLDGTAIENWNVFNSGADERVRGLLKAMLALPAYQLA